MRFLWTPATLFLGSLFFLGCHSSLDLSTAQSFSDAHVDDASNVVNVAYTYEFPEVYRGDYELKQVAIAFTRSSSTTPRSSSYTSRAFRAAWLTVGTSAS